MVLTLHPPTNNHPLVRLVCLLKFSLLIKIKNMGITAGSAYVSSARVRLRHD